MLAEVKLFLQREGYTTSAYNPRRLNGAVAPTSGEPAAPPAAFTTKGQPQLAIGDIVLSGYSSGSRALYRVFGNRTISGSPTDFPPELFGADPAEFDRRWRECWALDLFLNLFRKQLTQPPRRMADPRLPSRWATDWRDPRGQWLALFLSGPTLRATYVDQGVVPSFPISTPDGSKGDPAATIHPFVMGLGFGHAAGLR